MHVSVDDMVELGETNLRLCSKLETWIKDPTLASQASNKLPFPARRVRRSLGSRELKVMGLFRVDHDPEFMIVAIANII